MASKAQKAWLGLTLFDINQGAFEEPSAADLDQVTRGLGRVPAAQFMIVRRVVTGEPLVIFNRPYLDDGTPMPTQFWLLPSELHHSVSQLESSGGVKAVIHEIDADELSKSHSTYEQFRLMYQNENPGVPQPSGGVGGTREGVKCLHAHVAWLLAGYPDPVGRWTLQNVDEFSLAPL